MKGFNFEKNLLHQTQAVESTISVFKDLEIHNAGQAEKQYMNPIYNNITKQGNVFDNNYQPAGQFRNNVLAKQRENDIEENVKSRSNIIDIMMETGTGKTYTYTKTIFELNKNYGFFKFIVIVPTLSIKAGTIDFLKSDSARTHFKEQYGKTIKLHIVESKKGGKNKKSYMPPAVNSFVSAGVYEKNSIQVLIINAGMINSQTMQKTFDKSIFDKHSIPFEAISAIHPFLIIDEPHKFSKANKTWENIQKMKPQFILRYGATFPEKEIKVKNEYGKLVKRKTKDFQNLIYTLTAVDSFNRNLVKGVIGHITEFESGKNAIVKLNNTDGKEASFELIENNNKKTFKLSKKESLQRVHPAMEDLFIESLNRSKIVLSNGIVLAKGDKLNPYKKFPGHTKGSVFWNYEINTAGDDNSGRWDYSTPVWGYDMSVVGSNPTDFPSEPKDGIALGEEFSYEINVHKGIMYLTFMSEGHETKTFTKNLLKTEYPTKADIPAQTQKLFVPIGQDGVERATAYAGELNYFKQGAYNQTNGKDPEKNMVWCAGAETYGGDIAKQYANGDYTEVWFKKATVGESSAPKGK